MRTVVAWLVLGASVALAQGDFYLTFPPQLKEYLALSDNQIVRMDNTRMQVSSLQQPKYERQSQLLVEIAQETAKAAPDPAVLGTRYAELELIRRALETLQKSLVGQMQAILGADQKIKLATLEQALVLNDTACSAVGQNLLISPINAWFQGYCTNPLLAPPQPIFGFPAPGFSSGPLAVRR